MSETATFDAVIKALRMLKKIRRLEGTVLIHEGVLLSADTLLHDSQNESFVREVNALMSLYRNGDNSLSRAILGFDGGNVALFHAAPFTLALLFGEVGNAATVEKAGEDFLHQWADSLKIDSSRIGRLPALDLDDLVDAENEEKPEDLSAPEQSPAAESVPPAKPAPAAESGPETAPVNPFVVAAQSAATSESEPEIAALKPVPLAVVPVSDPEPDEEEKSGSLPESAQTEISEPSSMETSPEKRWSMYRVKVETLFSKVLGRAQATRLIERELTAMGVDDGGYLATAQFRPFGQKLIKRVKDRTLRKQLELELLSIVESFID